MEQSVPQHSTTTQLSFTKKQSIWQLRVRMPDWHALVHHDPIVNSPSMPNKTRRSLIEDAQNSTLGFAKIMAISLPERTDHRDALTLAAAVTGIEIDFIDGVNGSTVSEKTLPYNHGDVTKNAIGSWRAHMNAIQEVVRHGYESVLILEDDVDWDIRIKAQMRDLALSTNLLPQLEQRGFAQFADHNDIPIPYPSTSPYGDEWEVLWIGHCGMWYDGSRAIVTTGNDTTVPQVQYQRHFDPNVIPPLQPFPTHTRLVGTQRSGTCSLAYAITQRAARKLLFNLGLQRLETPFDLSLRGFCEQQVDRSNLDVSTGHPHHQNNHGKNATAATGDGDDSDDRGKRAAERRTGEEKSRGGAGGVFTVLPQLFDSHRRVGRSTVIDSDISENLDDYVRDKAFTPNIRWSVMLNMEKLVEQGAYRGSDGDGTGGETDRVEYDDQYPDV